MRKLRRIIIGLALLSAVSQQDFGPLVRLFTFPLALALYPLALAVIVGVLLAPFAFGLTVWLLWCRHRDGQFPGWAQTIARWLKQRLPHRLRVTTWAQAMRGRFTERWPRRRPREGGGRSMRAGRCRDCPATGENPAARAPDEGARSDRT
jgi:hypothetical protein